ncbi:calcium-binding protein [Streptomyces sp. CWNU-52B]|uniref:calcium-binding protein n=1 Tax=unclassified Streptomyces TaxID=2593676 RepID=UPI0039C0CD77
MRSLRLLATTGLATTSLALTLGGAVLMAPAAHAATTAATATVSYEDGSVWYKAAPGQTNTLSVASEYIDSDPDGDADDYLITFRDQVDITIDHDRCAYPSTSDHTVVECTEPVPLGSDDLNQYDVDLGDGDDTATVGAGSAQGTVRGGDGDDVLKGSHANQLNGDAGDDRIEGVDGAWIRGANGGDGNDTILAGCDYSCNGGAGNDTLTAVSDDERNFTTLYGDDGDDIVRGTTGDDYLYGGKGDDTLYGLEGDDTVYGNSGDDVLYGGAGNDTLSGGAGVNEVHQD